MTLPELFVTEAAQSIPDTLAKPSLKPSVPLISIENFEHNLLDHEIPTFTEPATLTAMRKLGIIPRDLRKVTDASVSDFPDLSAVREHVKDTMTRRRAHRIEQIIEVRNSILANSDTESDRPLPLFADSKITAEMKEREERENQRIERMQQKAIESLIISELTRQKILKQDFERQKQLQISLAQREAEASKKREEEQSRRKKKEEEVFKRLEIREREMIRKQKRNEKEHDERLKQDEEQRKKLAKERAVAEQERLKKVAERHEEIAARLRQEYRKAAQKEKEFAERDKERAKKNAQDLQQTRMERQARVVQTKQRIAIAAHKEQEMLESKRIELLRKEEDARERLSEFQQKKKAELKAQQEKNREDVQKRRAYSKVLEAEERKKREEIIAKQALYEERLSKVLDEKEKRIEQAKRDESVRIAAIAERKAKSEMNASKLQRQMEQEDMEIEERVRQIKHENKIERMKKIAERQLLLKTMEENAKSLERKREYETAEILRKKLEREKKALLVMEFQRLIGKKRKQTALQNAFRRADVMEEFKGLIQEGGKPDLEVLAQRFNLDMNVMRQKVEEGRHPELSNPSDEQSQDV
jgi:hypothetical protein